MLRNKILSKGLRRVEWYIKLSAIPFFSLVMVYMCSDYCPSRYYFLYFIINLIGITIGWILGRTIIFWLRIKMPEFTLKRISIQLFISLLAIILFTVAYVYIQEYVVGIEEEPSSIYDIPVFKIVTGVAIIFAFLINALYEGFFLFSDLSDTAIEAEKYKKANAENQLKNLTNKLNPHFLFNSFNTLVTIIEENPKKAVNYVQELSDVYRYVLNSDKQTWITLEEELQFCRSYITLLKMRFESNFEVYINVDKPYSKACILPLTMQLLIENAIKHNEISDQFHLNLNIYTDVDTLVVSNNINEKKVNLSDSTRIGLSNIKDRYRILTKKSVNVEEVDQQFIVRIPLISVKSAA